MKPTINISRQTILFTIFTLASLAFILLIKEIVLAVFLAFIIMSALNPTINLLQKYRFPRPLGIFLVYVLLFSFVGLLISVIVPPLVIEVTNLFKTLELVKLPAQIPELSFDLNQINALFDQFGDSVGSVLQFVTSTFSGVLFFFTLIVMSFYLLMDREDLPRYFTWVKPTKGFKKFVTECLNQIEAQLGSWVRGQVLLMVIIGLITYIGLTLLNIPYALPLAVFAAMLEILPNLGPTIAAVPAILIALVLVNPTMAGFVALFYILVQQAENNFIVPKIMKAAVDVDPIISILLILIGFKLLGVIGALLAIPLFITGRTVFLIANRRPLLEDEA